MILKRQEKDNVIKAMYNSSNIIASIYNKETSDLILIFNKGSQYKYPNVKSSDYTRFELAESQGKVFNSHIKAYSFEKLDNINPEAILTEVDDLKKSEQTALLEAKQLKVVKVMEDLLTKKTTLYTETQVETLLAVVQDYVNELSNQ